MVTRSAARHVSCAYRPVYHWLNSTPPASPCSNSETRPSSKSAMPRPVAEPLKSHVPPPRAQVFWSEVQYAVFTPNASWCLPRTMVRSSLHWYDLLLATPRVAVAAEIANPGADTVRISSLVGEYSYASMPRSAGAKKSLLKRLTVVWLNANRAAFTVLVPKTIVSPSVADWAMLSTPGSVVVRMLSDFASGTGCLSVVLM